MNPPAAPDFLVLTAVALPFVGAALIALLHSRPNLREFATLITATALCLVDFHLFKLVAAGARPEFTLGELAPSLSFGFALEPLGTLFALVASGLWILNSIYSIGYMRAEEQPRQTEFYVCFAIALGSTMGVAFAKNLFTLFLFYEALTLSTYPLVTHKADEQALRAGRVYLMFLLGTSMLLFLPAIIATWAIAGTLDFTPGGVVANRIGSLGIGLLLALYVFGIGKAAIMIAFNGPGTKDRYPSWGALNSYLFPGGWPRNPGGRETLRPRTSDRRSQ